MGQTLQETVRKIWASVLTSPDRLILIYCLCHHFHQPFYYIHPVFQDIRCCCIPTSSVLSVIICPSLISFPDIFISVFPSCSVSISSSFMLCSIHKDTSSSPFGCEQCSKHRQSCNVCYVLRAASLVTAHVPMGLYSAFWLNIAWLCLHTSLQDCDKWAEHSEQMP